MGVPLLIYALFFALVSTIAGFLGLMDLSPASATIAKGISLASFIAAIVFLALAKFGKSEELPFP